MSLAVLKGNNCLRLLGLLRSRDVEISNPKCGCIMGLMPQVYGHLEIFIVWKKKKGITFYWDIIDIFLKSFLVVTLETRSDQITCSIFSVIVLLKPVHWCSSPVCKIMWVLLWHTSCFPAYTDLLCLSISYISYTCCQDWTVYNTQCKTLLQNKATGSKQ